jgi:hypothetical protein
MHVAQAVESQSLDCINEVANLIGRGLLIGAALAKLDTAGDLIAVLPQ